MTRRTVFLSSPVGALAEYRAAVYAAIEGLEGYHCVRMEDFGAHDDQADDYCRPLVARCDVFVGILGPCYGSSPPGSEQSYSERQIYQAALDRLVREFAAVERIDETTATQRVEQLLTA